MRTLEPYPAYRKSGIPWLGDVPTHWDVRRIKTLFRERDQRSGNNPGTLLSLTRTRGLIPQDDSSRRAIGATDLSKYKVCMIGDLVMNRMQAWSGMFSVSPTNGLVSPDYSVFALIQPSFGNIEYFGRLFKTPKLVDQFARLSKGIGSGFNRLYTPDFGSVPVITPPLSEQTVTVRFLDHADRRIRRFIGARKKLIALLDEQKQAIVHEAVTGRIDVRTGQPYPAYKPSGIEWLGDVPTHWQVLRLGRVINLKVGFPFKSDDFTQSEEDMRLLRGINVAPGRLRWDDVVRWPADDVATFSEFSIGVGDIILGMDRPIIGNGIRVAVASKSDVPSLLLQRVACIRPHPESLVREFAFLILSSKNFVNYLSPIFTGISVPHLSPQQIKEFWISVPNIAEQKVIITHLTSRLSAIQSATERTQRQIDLLHEYRARLIADVVTGKLDVRAAAAALPEEPDGSDATEGDWAGPEGGDEGLTDHGRRTEFPVAQEEMIA